eukprot:3084248-Rhodomonas_salina.2
MATTLPPHRRTDAPTHRRSGHKNQTSFSASGMGQKYAETRGGTKSDRRRQRRSGQDKRRRGDCGPDRTGGGERVREVAFAGADVDNG